MRILHIMSWYMPNMIYQENYLPKHQQDLGHDVLIITGNKHDSKFKKLIETKIKPGIYYDKGVQIVRLKTTFSLPFSKQRFHVLCRS